MGDPRRPGLRPPASSPAPSCSASASCDICTRKRSRPACERPPHSSQRHLVGSIRACDAHLQTSRNGQKNKDLWLCKAKTSIASQTGQASTATACTWYLHCDPTVASTAVMRPRRDSAVVGFSSDRRSSACTFRLSSVVQRGWHAAAARASVSVTRATSGNRKSANCTTHDQLASAKNADQPASTR